MLAEQKNRQELLEQRAIERQKRQEKLVQERRDREKADDERKKLETGKSLILQAKNIIRMTTAGGIKNKKLSRLRYTMGRRTTIISIDTSAVKGCFLV